MATAPTSGRPWHHTHGDNFSYAQNAKVVASGRVPPRFQKKAWKAKQHAPERVVFKAESAKLKMHWELQQVH